MEPPAVSRRNFLQGGTAALAATAATAALAGTNANPVRIAVVGTGARGCDLIRALSTIDRAQIVAICDDYEPHLARGAEFAGPQARAFSDYARLLREEVPQAVVVAVPLVLHFEFCQQALDAGHDVFCEKLMCYSLPQARELAELVDRRQAVFQVGLQRRANAIYRQAAAMVETGMLGRISAIQCQWHRNHDWRRPVPVARGAANWSELEHRLNWRLYRQTSQGLMAELGSHQLDVANWLLGRPPARVLASGGIDYWRDGREVCDNVFCVYEYELPEPRAAGAGGPPASRTVRVTYSSLQNNAYEGASELVLGDRGTLFLTPKKGLFFAEEHGPASRGSNSASRGSNSAAAEAARVTSGKTLKMANDPWAFRGQPFEMDTDGDDTRDELVAFVDAVSRRDRQTICDAHSGVINAATVLMANEAMASGTAVEMKKC